MRRLISKCFPAINIGWWVALTPRYQEEHRLTLEKVLIIFEASMDSTHEQYEELPPPLSGLHRFLFSDRQDRQIFGICQAPSPYPPSIFVPTFTLSITADRTRLSRESETGQKTIFF
jgi:hypothetical protein